jgi:hypothetical protein
MGMGAEGDNFDGGSTEPSLPFFPINPALPGTELAILEERVGLLNPLSKFTFFLKLLIGWNPWFFFLRYGRGRGRGENERTAKEETISYEIPAGEFHGDILLPRIY